jgi:hypothetical protein
MENVWSMFTAFGAIGAVIGSLLSGFFFVGRQNQKIDSLVDAFSRIENMVTSTNTCVLDLAKKVAYLEGKTTNIRAGE